MFLQIGYKTLSYELLEQNVAFGVEALFGQSFFSQFSCLFVGISEVITFSAIFDSIHVCAYTAVLHINFVYIILI